jgi:hypothetical protein
MSSFGLIFSDTILEELIDEERQMLNKYFDCKNKIWSPPPTIGYNGSIDIRVAYKFEDPKTYSGPVVQGWEPGNLTQYQVEVFYRTV